MSVFNGVGLTVAHPTQNNVLNRRKMANNDRYDRYVIEANKQCLLLLTNGQRCDFKHDGKHEGLYMYRCDRHGVYATIDESGNVEVIPIEEYNNIINK